MIIEVDDSTLLTAAEIHSESWKDSHKDICTEEFLNKHSVKNQKDYLRDEMNVGKRVYMLIKEKPVGIVSVIGSLIENLYILPEKQHKGYGTELLFFAMEKCDGTPYLWILDGNVKAYSLYKKYGFALTGKRNMLSDTVSEVKMKMERRT